MPADTGVDDAGPGRLNAPRHLRQFAHAGPLLHQLQHRQPEDDHKALTAQAADRFDDALGKAHPPGQIAAPFIGTLVGARADELVDQIAFGTHHFDPVVARLLRQFGGLGKGANGVEDLGFGHRLGGKLVDWRFDRRRCHIEGVISITAGMQDLQADAGTMAMHGPGHPPMFEHLPRPGELAAIGHQPTTKIGGDTAGHNQAHPTPRPLLIEGCQLTEAVVGLFQPGMHGAHHHPVAQLHVTQIQRTEQMGVSGMGHKGVIPWRMVTVRLMVGPVVCKPPAPRCDSLR